MMPAFEKVDAALGARVHGVDLREPLTDECAAALRTGLFEHQVLFFADQPLTDEQHLEVARAFGTPNVYPVNAMLGGTQPLEFVEDGPGKPPVASNWHTDVTWLQDPPKIGMLSARVIPDSGGDTLWCSLYALHDALTPDQLARVSGLEVAHAAGEGFMHLVVNRFGAEFRERFIAEYGKGSRHALVREHYVTGRPLVYLSGGFMDHVVGADLEEGRALLRELMAIADDPAHTVRWKWRVDDFAIWDERSTMHRVDACHWPDPRKMRRCTIS